MQNELREQFSHHKKALEKKQKPCGPKEQKKEEPKTNTGFAMCSF